MTPDIQPQCTTSLLLSLMRVVRGVCSATAQVPLSPQGGEIPINLTTAGEQGTSAVSADLESRLAVVWQNQDASGSSIVAPAPGRRGLRYAQHDAGRLRGGTELPGGGDLQHPRDEGTLEREG